MSAAASAGTVGFRRQPGTHELPDRVLSCIVYSVVPWKWLRGYATTAVAVILDDARAEGLTEVEISADDDNIGSRRVIENNGGVFVGDFTKVDEDAQPVARVRYRITLR